MSSRRLRQVTGLIGLSSLIGIMLAVAPQAQSTRLAPSATVTIYDEALGSGWDDWSWDTTVNLANMSPAHTGTHSIAVTYTAAWGGLYLHADPAVDLSGYDTLRFWIHGGSAGNQHLRLVANGDDGNTAAVIAQANTWTQVNVTLSALGSPDTLAALYWQDTTGGAQATFYLDDIQLINTGLPTPTPS